MNELPDAPTGVPTNTPTGVPTDVPTDVARWDAELDRLELELAWTQRLLKVAEPLERHGWTPPRSCGPIPEHLVPRARRIAQQQAELQARLVAALVRLGQERQLAAAPEEPTRPHYIDLVG